MGRPFYPSEADDPDLDWLVSNFLYERPDFFPVESGSLPLMLVPFEDEEVVEGEEEETLEFVPEASKATEEEQEESKE